MSKPTIIINLTGGLLHSIASTDENINVVVFDMDFDYSDSPEQIVTSKIPGHYEVEEEEYYFSTLTPHNIISQEDADQYLNFLKEQEKRIFDEEE